MRMSKQKIIYIAHGFGERNHFTALYKKAGEYGYTISEQIILSNRAFLGRIARSIVGGRIKEAIGFIAIKIQFHFLKNQIIIVSLPAYDPTLIKYRKVFERNCCFFHSSHPFWDGSYYTKGSLAIRPQFEEVLRQCFVGGFCVNKFASEGLKPYIPDLRLVYHAIEVGLYNKKVFERNQDKKKCFGYDRTISYVYVGQLRKVKNATIILDWVRENTEANVSISFIGKGELESDIKRCARIDKRIKYKGYYEKSKLQKELCNYDYLILPSHFETLGIVILEAMAAGVPCIVSNVSGPLSIIKEGKTGFFFDVSKGLLSFNEVMKKSIDISCEDYRHMSDNAILEAQKYDVEPICKTWISLIEEKAKEYGGKSNCLF